MHKPSFWRGVVVAALVIVALGVGAYAVNAYDAHQQYLAAMAQATAVARATQTADAQATAVVRATAHAEATVAAQYTAVAQATVVAQATEAAQPATCLVGVQGHDATLIVSGAGARVECDRFTSSTTGGYTFTRGSYDTAPDTWQVDEGTGYISLGYVCSYSDSRLSYNVYDDGGRVYGGELCRHLANDPHTTPIPDTAATAIAQSTAEAQATVDTQVANATATAQAAPLYMHVCTDNDYDALAMQCKGDNKRIGAHDAVTANVAVGGGSTAWGNGVTGIRVEQMQSNGMYKRITPQSNNREDDQDKSFWILGNLLPSSDSGDVVPGAYRITVTVNGQTLPPHSFVVVPQKS